MKKSYSAPEFQVCPVIHSNVIATSGNSIGFGSGSISNPSLIQSMGDEDDLSDW